MTLLTLPAAGPVTGGETSKPGASHGARGRGLSDAFSRRWNDLPLRAKGIAVIGIPLLPLLLSALVFGLAVWRTHTASDWVTHTLQVKLQLATVTSLAADAETGVRDYLLTHDEAARRPFDDATAALPGATARLAELVADNPEQMAHLQRVTTLARAKPLPELLEFARANADARPSMTTLAAARETMQTLRRELGAMQEAEDRQLARRSQDTRTRLMQLSVAGAAFGLLGGVFAVAAFSSSITRRIDRVCENAFRMAHGEDLRPADTARDEVGELARAIAEASTLLRNREGQVRLQMTELAAVNHALDQARRELDQFFGLSLDLMCVAGTDGYFRRVNAAWQRTLGWTDEALTTTPYLDFIHPDDRAATAREVAKMAEGQTTISFENRFRCVDGSYRWLDWSSVATPERGLLFAAARDVTDEKQAAVALQVRAGELAAVNEELEAFSYSVSHDLRAPLRHVVGFSALLQKSAGDRLTDTEKRHTRTIVEAANRMGTLIDDLLAFSRMGRAAVERRRVALDDLVAEARSELQGVGSASDIVWKIHPLPTVVGDPAMLRLVFVNLLSNAAKYSAGRASPTIEVGTIEENSGETIVYVRDNGVGFDMAYADKLFGVFQRLHSSDAFEGTGIGLANVRRIIHRHGGRVWAEGVVDSGATFYFSLPHDIGEVA